MAALLLFHFKLTGVCLVEDDLALLYEDPLAMSDQSGGWVLVLLRQISVAVIIVVVCVEFNDGAILE